MTLPPEQIQPQENLRRSVNWSRYLPLTLVIASVITLVVYVPLAPWSLRWALLDSLLPWILAPSTGALSLALALLVLFWVPPLLRSWTGGARQPRREPARGSTVKGASPVDQEDPSGAEGEQLEIPAMSFREMGAEHRWELAEALDIPWRDELIHDHQSWTIACLEAAQHRATTPFS